MPERMNILNKRAHSADIIRYYGYPVVKNMVYGNDRQIAVHKIKHIPVVKINARDNDAVHSPVHGMFKVSHLLAGGIYKSDIVPADLGHSLEAVQNPGKIIMGKSASSFIDKKNADVSRTLCLERTRRRVRIISELFGHFPYMLLGVFTYVGMIVQCFADSSNGNTALFRDILHRDHGIMLLNRFRY